MDAPARRLYPRAHRMPFRIRRSTAADNSRAHEMIATCPSTSTASATPIGTGDARQVVIDGVFRHPRRGRSRHFPIAREQASRDARRSASALRCREAALGHPVRIKDNIDAAGLPTTAACPDFAYRPRRMQLCRAPARPVRSSSARPTSISSRPASSACARPIPCRATPRSGNRAGRIVVGLGGRGRARARGIRARDGHRGLRPRARRAQQHRRPEADARRRLDARRRPGLPHARHRLDLRTDRR